jgi:hypothetical protein
MTSHWRTYYETYPYSGRGNGCAHILFLSDEALRRAQVFAALKITASGASNGFVGEQEIEEWLSC